MLVMCLVFGTHVSLAQVRWNPDYQAYIEQYKDIAIEEMMEYHIPASITLAQGILESGAGKSYLSTHGNNHFGIKSHGWNGRTIKHDDDKKQESFRAYNSARESYQDHSRFIANRERYQTLFTLNPTDYVGWANGLKACGYATNPKYAQRLIGIIETYKLYEYDTMTRQANKPKEAIASNNVKTEKRASYQVHDIKAFNQNYYVYARRGDSFESIGKEMGLSASALAKYNERDVREQLQEGDVIYLRKKQKKADKRYQNYVHVVNAGESMYTISQKYGMRMANLYKINGLDSNYRINIGDRLKVR